VEEDKTATFTLLGKSVGWFYLEMTAQSQGERLNYIQLKSQETDLSDELGRQVEGAHKWMSEE
jgi:hypothetical protein